LGWVWWGFGGKKKKRSKSTSNGARSPHRRIEVRRLFQVEKKRKGGRGRGLKLGLGGGGERKCRTRVEPPAAREGSMGSFGCKRRKLGGEGVKNGTGGMLRRGSHYQTINQRRGGKFQDGGKLEGIVTKFTARKGCIKTKGAEREKTNW